MGLLLGRGPPRSPCGRGVEVLGRVLDGWLEQQQPPELRLERLLL
ncbi:hypothetical protein DB30_03612 [Enhygromyxa salina]|uniref:Uncharacterized protein n=1 Tax=Enhygromyxa salina TaxID=215803 RepID=A0A0C2D5P7_9BACT|nr:hypothetical protein DB30_03612 [Enhygromyxa salina]